MLVRSRPCVPHARMRDGGAVSIVVGITLLQMAVAGIAAAQGCLYPAPASCAVGSMCKRLPTGCAATCLPDGVGAPTLYYGLVDDPATPELFENVGTLHATNVATPGFSDALEAQANPFGCQAPITTLTPNGVSVDPLGCVASQGQLPPFAPGSTEMTMAAWISRPVQDFTTSTIALQGFSGDGCVSNGNVWNFRLLHSFGALGVQARTYDGGGGGGSAFSCLTAVGAEYDTSPGGPQVPVDGLPHFVVVTLDLAGAGVRIFVDGVELGVLSQPPLSGRTLSSRNANVAVGGDAILPSFPGDIYELAVYDRALTPTEIGDLFALGSEVFLVDAAGDCLPAPEPSFVLSLSSASAVLAVVQRRCRLRQ